MSGGGGSQPSTTTNISKSEPPAYVQPYSEQLMQRAGGLSNAPYTPYGGQRIAGLNADHNTALQMTENRAINGSPDINAARNNLAQTMSGAYMYPGSNPYLNSMFDASANRITDAYRTGTAAQTDAAFARANAFGGSAYNQMTGMNQRALGDSLSKLASDTYGKNYTDERTNQMRGMLFAPQLAQTDYQDAQALLGVGDIRREAQQEQLNQGYSDFLQQQQYPYQQLDVLANAIRTSMGGGGTMTSTGANPYQSNRTAGALGGALSGAASGAMMGSVVPGIGTMMGALIGGGMGLLGGYAMNQGAQSATGGDFKGMDNADIAANVMQGGTGFTGGNPYMNEQEKLKNLLAMRSILSQNKNQIAPILMMGGQPSFGAPALPNAGSFAALSPYNRK